MVSSRGRDPLAIWMNNELVGTWSMTRANVEMFSYENEWLNSPRSRPLSLTLPFLPGNEPHRGNHVESWFENLLPDALEIRRRIARRFGVHTLTPGVSLSRLVAIVSVLFRSFRPETRQVTTDGSMLSR